MNKNTEPVKVVFFDCGAVILSNSWNKNGEEPSYDIIPEKLEISKEKGRKIFYKHWPKIKVGKKSEIVFFQDLIDNAKKKISLEELRDLYYDCILKKDAFETVEKLHKKYPDLPFYTMNNEGKEWMDVRIRKFGMNRLFRDFITSGYVGYAKPERKIYEIALERSGREAKNCLFIDDKETVLLPAKEMGFQIIHFEDKEKLERDLKNYVFSH